MERGHIQGLPKFFDYPLLSQERIKLRTSNLAVYSRGPSEQKPFKILGENGAWAYPGTAQILWVPSIISGTGKATNFNICTQILSIGRNKSPLQIYGKVAGCVVRTFKTFQCTYILGALCGLLCDSSAVLLDLLYMYVIVNVGPWMQTWKHWCRILFSLTLAISPYG